MQGKSLKIAAAVLFGLAILVGLYGARLSQSPPSAAVQVQAPPTVTIPHFAADLPVGTVLRAEMIQPMPVAQPLVKDIRDPAAYYGRRLIQPVVAGSRLRDTMFSRPRPLMDELKPGFRAIALQANALTVVGGHLQSGDWVDVLYLLRANKESGSHSTARRLLSRIQVLAVGLETIGQAEPSSQSGKGNRDSARTIVLAIPEAETPQLLLAESTGQLRLTLVSPEELLHPSLAVQAVAAETPVSDLLKTDAADSIVPSKTASVQSAGKTQAVTAMTPVTAITQHATPTQVSNLTGGQLATQRPSTDPETQEDSYVISLKTLGGYQEVDVPAAKPPPVKYRYVAPSVEVYQGESRALVQTRF
ncbi:Flp pilus assembly protein CpaB [Photobacterium sp. TY1-4]|uniref:Flp pilus assembly protein CpaB n=1 Tax=Photobacterium sp. TY1-4 TaxID=2899122 RepID=UPI0021C0DD82|nr:Flp pilus assembly protein CpaB [Photobacterium sp. TY1-4]UXI02186.1 Flp pilus assembly protein CpaB [Photobacterium sp. TY1-4]